MRVALYGGSFNPPHKVHALVAEWVVSSGVADAVWLVPVFQHAFEGQHGKLLAPFKDRVRWCEALAKDIATPVEVSAVESKLSTPSYSIDTLDHLAALHPNHRFRLVVGSDILEAVDGWKAWDRIQAEYAPIIVGRAGYAAPAGVPVFPNISSTEVRQRVVRGMPLDEWVTPAVQRLLEKDSPWTPSP